MIGPNYEEQFIFDEHLLFEILRGVTISKDSVQKAALYLKNAIQRQDQAVKAYAIWIKTLEQLFREGQFEKMQYQLFVIHEAMFNDDKFDISISPYMKKAIELFGQSPRADIKETIRNVLIMWEQNNKIEKNEVAHYLKLLDKKDSGDNIPEYAKNFPPPQYLVNLANNWIEAKKRKQKIKDVERKLNEVLSSSYITDREAEYHQLIEQYQKLITNDAEQKKELLRTYSECLKQMDKQHYQMVIELKYLCKRMQGFTNTENQQS